MVTAAMKFKRRLLLGRKAMTNLDSILKNRDIAFPISGSFQMSQLFPSGGKGIGVSASISVLPMNNQNYLL